MHHLISIRGLCLGTLIAVTTSCAHFQGPILSIGEIQAGIPELASFVEQRMESMSIDIVGIAILADRRIVYEETFGASDGVIFQGASLSKMITAMGAMGLVRDGLLAMDTPLDNYLPEPYLTEKPSRPIMLFDVLTHTSGLPNDVSGVKRTLGFQPGQLFRYSGTGFNYLQHCIEAVTEKPFSDWMAEAVLPNAGMNSSYFRSTGDEKIEAGAGLMTTPGDVARFFLYLTDPAAADILGDPRPEMLLPLVQIQSDKAWGLGIGVQTGPIANAIWHWGNNEYYHYSLAVYFLESDIGVVIMMQGTNGNLILREIAAAAIGGYHSDYWTGVMGPRIFRESK